MLYKIRPIVQIEKFYDPDHNVINISTSKELFLSFTLCKEIKWTNGQNVCEFDYDHKIFNIHSELVSTRVVNNQRVYDKRALN
jgi:hypothetical protein